jgi:hypothetical protein
MYFKLILKLSFGVGALVGLLMCYIGWQHNPQCEFHCEDSINWLAILMVWVSWCIGISLVVTAALSLINYVYKVFRGGQNA